MNNPELRTLLLCLILQLAAASTTAAEERCTTPFPAQHCMIGTWQAESTNALSAHNQASTELRRQSHEVGDNQFVFAADGTYSQESKRASTSRFEHKIGSSTRQQMVSVTSKSSGRWSPSGSDGIVLCKEAFEMNMGEGGAPTPLPPEVIAAETTGEIAYKIACQDDRAEFTMLMPGGPRISWVARRVQH